ncbi:hypothetical protein C8R43DRAFT_1231071 [Mycena crocata]|nr:hypothetical protein C8R43DRAFT_1231071 [Mycena crocata]
MFFSLFFIAFGLLQHTLFQIDAFFIFLHGYTPRPALCYLLTATTVIACDATYTLRLGRTVMAFRIFLSLFALGLAISWFFIFYHGPDASQDAIELAVTTFHFAVARRARRFEVQFASWTWPDGACLMDMAATFPGTSRSVGHVVRQVLNSLQAPRSTHPLTTRVVAARWRSLMCFGMLLTRRQYQDFQCWILQNGWSLLVLAVAFVLLVVLRFFATDLSTVLLYSGILFGFLVWYDRDYIWCPQVPRMLPVDATPRQAESAGTSTPAVCEPSSPAAPSTSSSETPYLGPSTPKAMAARPSYEPALKTPPPAASTRRASDHGDQWDSMVFQTPPPDIFIDMDAEFADASPPPLRRTLYNFPDLYHPMSPITEGGSSVASSAPASPAFSSSSSTGLSTPRVHSPPRRILHTEEARNTQAEYMAWSRSITLPALRPQEQAPRTGNLSVDSSNGLTHSIRTTLLVDFEPISAPPVSTRGPSPHTIFFRNRPCRLDCKDIYCAGECGLTGLGETDTFL